MEPPRTSPNTTMSDLITRLEQAWQVTEQPFKSTFPVLGPLIAWFRERCNRISTRWYVLKLLEQQNQFNRLLVELAYQVNAIQGQLSEVQASVQTRFEMMDHLMAQQADLVTDRGLSIAALAEGMARLSEQVLALKRQADKQESENE